MRLENDTTRLEKTRAECLDNLKQTPDDSISLHLLGLIEQRLGNHAEALGHLRRAAALRPDSVEILSHYAVVLADQAQYDEAVAAFMRVLAIDTNHIDTHYGLANTYKAMGAFDQATDAYRKVLELNPGHIEALNNLGVLYNDRQLYSDAIACFQRAIAADPACALAYNNLGISLSVLDMFDDAEVAYRGALAIDPDYLEAVNNLGILLWQTGRYAQSRQCYRRVLAKHPDYPQTLSNLANTLKDCGELDEAIALYRKVVGLSDTALHRKNLALALLVAGRMEEGWREYEKRKQVMHKKARYLQLGKPQWQGREASDQTILLHAEQGFGDTIQFCRYAPMVAAKGLRVILEVQPALVRLLSSLPGIDAVVAQGRDMPVFDLQCSLMSLPLAFETASETIPASIPYLTPDAAAVVEWRHRLSVCKNNVKVGLVWAGSPQRVTTELASIDRRRSLPPRYLEALAGTKGVDFISLQKNGPPPPQTLNLIDHMDLCRDFADTAALIANLDLVISVDTAVAHLAGAIGKPVWLLNRFDTCWRWFRDRTDSPWYPTMRIFRQPEPGDWNAVLAQVKTELQRFSK